MNLETYTIEDLDWASSEENIDQVAAEDGVLIRKTGKRSPANWDAVHVSGTLPRLLQFCLRYQGGDEEYAIDMLKEAIPGVTNV